MYVNVHLVLKWVDWDLTQMGGDKLWSKNGNDYQMGRDWSKFRRMGGLPQEKNLLHLLLFEIMSICV